MITFLCLKAAVWLIFQTFPRALIFQTFEEYFKVGIILIFSAEDFIYYCLSRQRNETPDA